MTEEHPNIVKSLSIHHHQQQQQQQQRKNKAMGEAGWIDEDADWVKKETDDWEMKEEEVGTKREGIESLYSWGSQVGINGQDRLSSPC